MVDIAQKGLEPRRGVDAGRVQRLGLPFVQMGDQGFGHALFGAELLGGQPAAVAGAGADRLERRGPHALFDDHLGRGAQQPSFGLVAALGLRAPGRDDLVAVGHGGSLTYLLAV